VPKSNSQKLSLRTNKYAKQSRLVRDVICHSKWQFSRFLERLVNDPYAPNHLDRIADGEPVLRDALRKAGVAALTREQHWAKRDEYFARLEAGEEPYSSKLCGVEWIPAN
jgi:hypothetical protein